MLRNYFITALRYIIRNQIPSFIQILSLALGLTVFTMVVLYMYDELTVDRFNAEHEQVYRIEVRNRTAGGSKALHPWPLAPALLEEIPEIKHVTRTKLGQQMYLTAVDESGKPGKHLPHDKNTGSVDVCIL